MRRLFVSLALATVAVGISMLPAKADVIISCPLPQATRAITGALPPGWSAQTQVSPVTDYKVDTSSGQPRLVCTYGAAGPISRAAPFGQLCAKIPGQKFKCTPALPPPGPVIGVVSDGLIVLADNNTADLDSGSSAADIRLRADNPFLRLLEPVNNTRFSPQGTATPDFNTCKTAPYSPGPIPQAQLPVGVWLCVKTSDGNFGRLRVSNINGIPGLPLPMTIYFDHTTWSASGGGGGGGPLPPPPQPIHSQDTLQIQQTFSVDLDEGNLASGPDADLWFQAVTASQLFLKPMNGAQLAVGNKSDRGYDGCAAEAFSPNPVALGTLPAGSFVCFATNQGRVGQFRVQALTGGVPKKLTIQYRTWE
jgi:hypothetical protein